VVTAFAMHLGSEPACCSRQQPVLASMVQGTTPQVVCTIHVPTINFSQAYLLTWEDSSQNKEVAQLFIEKALTFVDPSQQVNSLLPSDFQGRLSDLCTVVRVYKKSDNATINLLGYPNYAVHVSCEPQFALTLYHKQLPFNKSLYFRLPTNEKLANYLGDTSAVYSSLAKANDDTAVLFFDRSHIGMSNSGVAHEVACYTESFGVCIRRDGLGLLVPKNNDKAIRLAIAVTGSPRSLGHAYVAVGAFGVISADALRRQLIASASWQCFVGTEHDMHIVFSSAPRPEVIRGGITFGDRSTIAFVELEEYLRNHPLTSPVPKAAPQSGKGQRPDRGGGLGKGEVLPPQSRPSPPPKGGKGGKGNAPSGKDSRPAAPPTTHRSRWVHTKSAVPEDGTQDQGQASASPPGGAVSSEVGKAPADLASGGQSARPSEGSPAAAGGGDHTMGDGDDESSGRKRTAPQADSDEVLRLRRALEQVAKNLGVDVEALLQDPQVPSAKRSRSQDPGAPAAAAVPVPGGTDMDLDGPPRDLADADDIAASAAVDETERLLNAMSIDESERIRLAQIEEQDSLNPLEVDFDAE